MGKTISLVKVASIGALVLVLTVGCAAPIKITSENYLQYTLKESDFSVVAPNGFTEKVVQSYPDYGNNTTGLPFSSNCVVEGDQFSTQASDLTATWSLVTSAGFASKRSTYQNFFALGQTVFEFKDDKAAVSFVELNRKASDVDECLSLFAKAKAGELSTKFQTHQPGVYIEGNIDGRKVLSTLARNGTYVSFIQFEVENDEGQDSLRSSDLERVVAGLLTKFAG